MRTLVSIMLLVTMLFGYGAFAEGELHPGIPKEEIWTSWGESVDQYGTAHVWEKDGKVLIASFRDEILRDYVLLENDRTYIDGTIPAENTLFHVYDRIASTPVDDMPQVFGVGSSYNAIMTADGYIVSWLDDYPNIFFDIHMHFYDCVTHETFDGRMWEYLLYTLLPK